MTHPTTTHRIAIKQIAHVLNPGPPGRRHLVVLSFFADESYDSKVFTFGGFMATENEWHKLKLKWDKKVKQAGVPRFHAAPLNGYKDEFAEWRGTSKSSDFVKSLINIIAKRKTVGLSFAMLLNDYEKYTSALAKDKLGTPYLCCFKHCIAMVAQEMSEMPPEDKFAVIIDRNPEETAAVELFYKIKDDSAIPYRHRLATCAPGGWEEFTPLQAADMIAYDTFKLLDDTHFRGKAEFRKSLQAIFDSTRLLGKFFDKECFDSIRGKIESAEGQSVIVEANGEFMQ